MGGGGATEITRALPMVNARYVKAKTCVWWDIENCGVPRSCDPYSIAQNISKSLADMNYKGVITISAYGDTRKIDSSAQQALSSTGIALNHVPAGIKDASDKKILVDMLIWGYDNPPPANHLLISGDRDFSNALHQLSLRKYNILLAQPEKASQALVSAAKTVWLWTSLAVGGRPFDKLPNFHNTSTNNKSNIVTESNRILHSSQPVDFNLKNNNNGNFSNGNDAKQNSKTQSHLVVSSSSSSGIEDGNKRSIESSDSSKSNHENGLKHPSHPFVSTTADLASNCTTSVTNSTPFIPKSEKIVNFGKFNAQCRPTSNYTPEIERKYGNKIPSNTATTDGSGLQEITTKDTTKINNDSALSHPSPLVVPESSKPLPIGPAFANIQPIPDMVRSNHENELTQPSHAHEAKESGNIAKSTTDGSEMQESTINDTMKINNKSTSSQPSPLVVPESSKPLSIGPTFATIQPLPDMASSNHENEQTQPSDAHEAKGENISNTSSSFSMKPSSQALPESSCITCNTNPTPCIPEPQQLVDSVKFNAPCEPVSSYIPKFMQRFVQRTPSNIAKSTTDGSEVQESTINDTTKISNKPTSPRPSSPVVPEPSKPLSIGPAFTNIQPLLDVASSNHENELTQPSDAHEAKGGNISNTSSSFSTKSSSQALPDSNCITCDTNPTPCIPKPQELVDFVKFNAPYEPVSSYIPKFMQRFVQRIPSNIVKSTTDGSEVQESAIHDTTKISNNSTSSRPSPLVVPESGKPLSIGPAFANVQPLPDMASGNHENELTQPTHAHEAKDGGNINSTSSSFSMKSSCQVLPESYSPNEPKINANSKVKPVIKGNRKCYYKQQQNKYPRSHFQSRNSFGANYNHSSSSSSAPTIRPNNYQSVPSTVPNVSPSTPIPDIGKLNISNHPYPTQSMNGSSIFTGDTMPNNLSGGNLKWPASANYLGGQMGFILEALNILKSDKISPTKANISDCFRYRNIDVQNFNVQSALEYAIEHQVVVMHKSEGNCMDLYVGRNDTLWNCVNVMDSDANHDTEKFDSVLKFLSSAVGRSAIISSQCRYQAALILKQFCLKEIVLGEILQILDIVIRFRKWINPHPEGWQPLAVTVSVDPNEDSTSSPSTAFGWG